MSHEVKPVRFAILLSTYNGEAYLPTLLESILNQNWKHWDLWIRDDGSTDGTRDILREFSSRFNGGDEGPNKNTAATTPAGHDAIMPGTSSCRIHNIEGVNLGIANSFFHLLEKSCDGYDGYAFCDQDDIWVPEKLERAAQALEAERPMLYHARQWIMDEDSGKKSLSPRPVHTGFSNALIQNQVVGCTMVINAQLRACVLESLQSVLSGESSGEACRIIMHDWWCYLIASGTGTICYERDPVILFRRHRQSTTPAAAGSISVGRKRLAAFQKLGWSISHIMDQATLLQQFLNNNQPGPACQVPDRHRQELEQLLELRSAGFFKRLGYLFSGRHRRSSLAETIFFRMLVLLRRF